MKALVVSFITLFTALGATAQVQSPQGLDVNDVTILFPLDSQKLPFPNVRLNGHLTSQQLSDITNYVYQYVTPNFNDASLAGSPRVMDSWRIVALRVDPCFVEDAHTACVPQVRLVTQVIEDSFGMSDQSIHLLYQLSADELLQAVRILQAVKQQSAQLGVQTAGKSLQPHPGLTAELADTSKARSISNLVEKLISKFCTTSRLKHVTIVGAENAVGPWVFVGGDIVGARWVARPIPSLDQQNPGLHLCGEFDCSTLQHGFVQSSDRVNAAFPLPVGSIVENKHSMREFMQTGDGAAVVPSSENLRGLFDVMNPKLANPKNTDCASCHVNNEFVQRQSDLSLLNPFRDVYKNPRGITGFAQSRFSALESPDLPVVRVIGYNQDLAIITPLVAQSSADVAETLNNLLHLPPPTSRDCSDFKIFECFNKLGHFANDSQAGTDKYCLRLCR